MPALQKLIVDSLKLTVILLGLGIWGLVIAPPKAGAACYCQDPSVCRCSTAAPEPAKQNPASIGGVAVYCDTPAEASSQDAIRALICGSSPEVIPKCAKGADGNPGFLVCWGSSVATGTTDLYTLSGKAPPDPKSSQTYNPPVPFKYNGNPYGITGTNYVTVCADNLICCGNISNCYPPDIPTTPSSCPNQNESVIPPVDICGVVGGTENPVPQSQTDARIYFPHVKNTSSITYLLQSMFRPISWTVDEIVKNVVYSKVFEHQGVLPDKTKVINTKDNNSSVIPGNTAPPIAFTFKHPPDASIPHDGSCLITDVRINPGDDLLGKKVYANLQYTQKFKYDLKTNCGLTNSSVKPNNKGFCCSGNATCARNPDTGEEYACHCDPDYIHLPTKGKSLVFTKSPFLEYLYQNLVAGPAGIYRRFVAQDIGNQIKDIPTQATIAVSGTAPILVANSKLGKTADIYFPHLGSVYDYFLKNLQKLLRPFGGATAASPSGSFSPGSLSCTTPLTSCPAVNWQDPIFDTYYNVYNSDTNSSWSLVKEPWAQDLITSSGMCSKFVATLWLEESGGSAIGSYDLGCIYNFNTKAKSQENTHPTNLSPSQLLQYRTNILTEQLSCLKSYVDAIGDDFSTFMCQYSGEADTDPNKPFRQCTTFTNNPNFPSNFCKILNGSLPGGNPGPIVPPGPPPPAATGDGFTVSGSPSQICQSAWYGIRHQAGTNNCIRCLGGQIASGFGSTSNVFPCPASMTDLNVCSDSQSDFSTTPIPNSPSDNWPDGLQARCFQGKVIDIQPATSINSSFYACPTSQYCRSTDTSATGLDLSCQPQYCSNPGTKSGSGQNTSGHGDYCCVPKITSP